MIASDAASLGELRPIAAVKTRGENRPLADVLSRALRGPPPVFRGLVGAAGGRRPNGAMRVATYGKGELAAHQLSTLIGAAALGVAIWFIVRTWPPSSNREALAIGLV